MIYSVSSAYARGAIDQDASQDGRVGLGQDGHLLAKIGRSLFSPGNYSRI